jgi:hypothetical protein
MSNLASTRSLGLLCWVEGRGGGGGGSFIGRGIGMEDKEEAAVAEAEAASSGVAMAVVVRAWARWWWRRRTIAADRVRLHAHLDPHPAQTHEEAEEAMRTRINGA